MTWNFCAKTRKKQMKQFEQSQKKNQKKANELAKEAAKAENEVKPSAGTETG